ncbi:MAG: GatB/YqeY domain-containing protein [Gammaproteobacteria bacterium]|nr:MAG: GatB/YqeY domain-containing protein [Gammaproteobacteria bacterium]
MPLKDRIQADMKAAMRAGDKARLGTIRMLLAAIKQKEVDERSELDDAAVLQIVEKLIKQRREAAAQFTEGGREELAAKELGEAEQLQAYLPEPLDPAALAALIDAAIAETGAGSMRDMGKVMNLIRARAQGRADMAEVSKQVKARLAG